MIKKRIIRHHQLHRSLPRQLWSSSLHSKPTSPVPLTMPSTQEQPWRPVSVAVAVGRSSQPKVHTKFLLIFPHSYIPLPQKQSGQLHYTPIYTQNTILYRVRSQFHFNLLSLTCDSLFITSTLLCFSITYSVYSPCLLDTSTLFTLQIT